MTESERTDLWNRRLTAKFNICYYRCLVIRTSRIDKWTRAGIVLFSSGTLGTLFLKAGSPWPEISAVLTTILSVLHSTVLEPVKCRELYSTNYGRWVQVAHRYEELWMLVESRWGDSSADTAIRQQISEASQLEVDVRKAEASVPDEEGLKMKCRDSVRRQEGLK